MSVRTGEDIRCTRFCPELGDNLYLSLGVYITRALLQEETCPGLCPLAVYPISW